VLALALLLQLRDGGWRMAPRVAVQGQVNRDALAAKVLLLVCVLLRQLLLHFARSAWPPQTPAAWLLACQRQNVTQAYGGNGG
jgi:hypothetical protein